VHFSFKIDLCQNFYDLYISHTDIFINIIMIPKKEDKE
jgi:hypothetical protein